MSKKHPALKEMGLGYKPLPAEALDDAVKDDKTPPALMWFICTIYFGMRTGKECHDLCLGDVALGLDEESVLEYLQCDKERQTKRRTGVNPRDTR